MGGTKYDIEIFAPAQNISKNKLKKNLMYLVKNLDQIHSNQFLFIFWDEGSI
jgi:hypothetical protein